MIRFAVAVTAMEILLTLGACLWIAYADRSEPTVTQAEFGQLGITLEKYSTDHRMRFGSFFSYETLAQVADGGPAITVSVRVNTPRAEYDTRLAGEKLPRLRDGDEAPVVTDESWPDESGYGVRQCGRNGARAEIVRLRGSTMIVIRAVHLNVSGNVAHHAAARAERLVRLVQDHLVVKLGWREPSW